MSTSIDRWLRVKELFSCALEVAPCHRGSFLRGVINDKEVTEEVNRLLDLEALADGFLIVPLNPIGSSRSLGFKADQVVDKRYRILRALGEGGMGGGVYEALDMQHSRRVALKAAPDLREYFVALAIEHPNVCRMFDCGTDGEQQYFTMELIEGSTLEQYLLEHGPLAAPAVAEFGAQFVEGLAAIQDAGIIHGDLKPANVLLTPTGRVVIIDFGLAWFLEERRLEENPFPSAGTLLYLAPEVLSGAPPSARSDLYSLAAVICEAATGQVPLDDSEVPPSLPPELGACLNVNPAMRPVSIRGANIWPLPGLLRMNDDVN